MVALDDRGNFLGDRGVHIVSRSGVTNLGRPVFVSTANSMMGVPLGSKNTSMICVAAVERAFGAIA